MNAFQEPAPRQEKLRDIQQRAKTLTDDVSELFELYYRLAVLTATEKASNAVSASVTGIMMLFLMMFTLLFAGLALGWYLGEKLNSMLAGFGIVAGFFSCDAGPYRSVQKIPHISLDTEHHHQKSL